MKKISLKNLNLNETEQLSREKLKNVLGGYTDGTGGGTDVGLSTGDGARVFIITCTAWNSGLRQQVYSSARSDDEYGMRSLDAWVAFYASSSGSNPSCSSSELFYT